MVQKTVDIRPGVSVLAVLRHLNYRPWYALGEFVDNSVESYLRNRAALQDLHGGDFSLCVEIDIDTSTPARISIRDNAAGISEDQYGRAFRPAAVPTDRTGLAEFGMGMKSAACWFAPCWSVRTSALGETVTRKVSFDIENIVHDDIQELEIQESKSARNAHFTEVVLEDIFQVPHGRTIGKLKEHLSDIYRSFARQGILQLKFNGEVLRYQDPKVLRVPYFKEIGGQKRTWRKEISFDFGDGLSVNGFAALREKANTAKAGFSLFRRGRVIQGSGDEGYRPAFIFGSSNSYRYQRLFGELHLDGFDVSHTKDGFRWDENEQPFLELLREHLDSDDLPLLKQAEGYRVRATKKQLEKAAMKAVANTSEVLETQLPKLLPKILGTEPEGTAHAKLSTSVSLANRAFNVRYRDQDWLVDVELTADPAESQWLVLSDVAGSSKHPRSLRIRVSMSHPFMVQFAQTDSESVESLLRVAAAIALAEVVARDAGVRNAGTIRRNVNEIISSAFAEN